jgi:hypothetical protein
MASSNIDFSKAREREPAYFVGVDDITGRQGIYAPITRDKIMMQGNIEIDTNPISGAIDALPAVELHMASQSNLEIVWDELVRKHHYLGYQRLLGHRLKYIAFMDGRPVAALSFSAPALRLRVRDKYIGWSAEQRKTYLERIVNNSRFLILPWIRVKNLASHVLALALARLSGDWQERFGRRLWLVETFVDPTRYKGTSYRAANSARLPAAASWGKAMYIMVASRRYMSMQ